MEQVLLVQENAHVCWRKAAFLAKYQSTVKKAMWCELLLGMGSRTWCAMISYPTFQPPSIEREIGGMIPVWYRRGMLKVESMFIVWQSIVSDFAADCGTDEGEDEKNLDEVGNSDPILFWNFDHIIWYHTSSTWCNNNRRVAYWWDVAVEDQGIWLKEFYVYMYVYK